MMSFKSKKLLIFFLVGLSQFFRPAHADAVHLCALESLEKLNGLLRTECHTASSTIIEKYSDQKNNSPYATEFDRRHVVVVTANSLIDAYRVAGIKPGQYSDLPQTRLLTPPSADQIAGRHVSRRIEKFKNWRITIERIQYLSQSPAPGYVLNCATAIENISSVRVVAECYPLENKIQFLEILNFLQ